MAKPKAAPAVVCEWLQDIDGNWATSCGNLWCFNDCARPEEHKVTFCPYCGGRIKVKE